ncbi:hypothetical protein [Chitiniphilus shinanonensis]|uniref:hypothetical protein n=1 Tax=Chitiniphilus shinanonensis TaxID=553088 RepID=UPI0030663F0A
MDFTPSKRNFQIKDGFLFGTRGRIRADEMDMAVLNVGAGKSPMTQEFLQKFDGSPFLRPVINLEFDKSLIPEGVHRVDQSGGMLDLWPSIPGRSKTLTEPEVKPIPQRSNYVQGDATSIKDITRKTGFRFFDQIHAVNPYGFDPLISGQMLAPGGMLHVTGTFNEKRQKFTNPFAKPPEQLPHGLEKIDTTPMIPLHQSMSQTKTHGEPLKNPSRTTTYMRPFPKI